MRIILNYTHKIAKGLPTSPPASLSRTRKHKRSYLLPVKPVKLLLLAFLPPRLSSAQFYLVSDKDGYANVRSKPDIGSRIIDTLNNGNIVYFLEEKIKNNWLKISYWRKTREYKGYIFHDRLKSLDEYDSIPPQDYDDNSMTYGKDSVKVIITQEKFNAAPHRFSYNKDKEIELIDGKHYWGTDGFLPTSQYKSIIVIFGSRRISLPKAALDNLFTPDLGHEEVYCDRENDVLYIHAMNWRAAAASYDVIWRVVKGVYADRYIEDSDNN
jgi:hypothetical protein